MRTFQEQMEKDLDHIFFNMKEFAELHNIDGEEVPIVMDSDILLELNLGKLVDVDGIYQEDKMFFIQKIHLKDEPVIGQIMEFDGEPFPIWKVIEDPCSYIIILRGNES